MVLYFKGGRCVLSNFYPCNIYYQNKWFTSTEHIYQYKKATFFGEMKLAEKIKHAETPQEAKKLSNQIPHSKLSSEWSARKLAIMKAILDAKLQQLPLFKTELLNTGNLDLIHNVADDFWGTGKHHCGQNQFGRLLMLLRQKIQTGNQN